MATCERQRYTPHSQKRIWSDYESDPQHLSSVWIYFLCFLIRIVGCAHNDTPASSYLFVIRISTHTYTYMIFKYRQCVACFTGSFFCGAPSSPWPSPASDWQITGVIEGWLPQSLVRPSLSSCLQVLQLRAQVARLESSFTCTSN